MPDETPVAPVPTPADPLPTTVSHEDCLELALFAEKVNGVSLRMQLVQKDLQAIEADRAEFVNTKLKPKYKLGDGDGIDPANGKILRKGDPNIQITGKPAAPATGVTPALMG